uniref:WW domain-containing protein n=1 Tax=Haemonchus placei TaxID=6290 RepID=A0A0N4W2J7_HAEPC
LQERSEAKDIPMMSTNRQHAPTHPKFTAAQKRTSNQSRTPQTGGNLVVPPPLPKVATRKEQMELMGSSSPDEQIRGQTYGEIIDPKKLQLHSSRHGSHNNPKASSAYQALTAEPSELAREEEEEEDTFKAISALSDRYGIHHRPRSRSPFTRPGLWEPNPDNPHNRDHANKWWYNPYSVTADWLNGQEGIKLNAYREVLYNRLKTLQTRIPDGYLEWPDDPTVPANRQYATRNVFTTLEQRLDPKTGPTSAETMDSQKVQARRKGNRFIRESGGSSSPRVDRRGLIRTLRAINSLTADPMTFSTERTMPSLDKPFRADQALKAEPPDAAAEEKLNTFQAISSLSDRHGVHHRPRSRSPFVRPGLWEPNPDNPHNRDHANKWYYHPFSVGADWLGGQASWGRHWAVPAAGVGGTDEYSEIHFPSLGTVLNIPDDYD